MVNKNVKHPDSSFAAQYPYNQATITRSGHEIDIDDTPGAERLKVSHTAGTYIEIDSFGMWTQVVVDKAYMYYKDGVSETIDGHKDVKIAGTLNVNVDGSVSEQTAGAHRFGTGGDSVNIIGGNQSTHVNHNRIETIDGSCLTSIEKDNHLDITGDSVTHVGQTKTDIVGGLWAVQASNQGIDLQTLGAFSIKCSSFNIITPQGVLSIGPNGISLNGTTINVTGSGQVTMESTSGNALVKSDNGSTTIAGSSESFTLN